MNDNNKNLDDRLAATGSLGEKEARVIIDDHKHFMAAFKSGDIVFIFKSERSGTNIKSTLEIGNKDGFTETHIDVDESLMGYRLNMHNFVISEALRIISSPQLQQAYILADLYELFGTQVLGSVQETSSSIIQSMYFHNAIINIVARSAENEKGCECTPDPGYFVGKKSFWCQEDFYILPELVLFNLEKSGKFIEDDHPVIDYLKANKSRSRIAISELYGLQVSKERFMAQVDVQGRQFDKINFLASSQHVGNLSAAIDEESSCFEGSDWGCCGNYAGCCWYSSVFCLFHDAQCMCCSPGWYCLSWLGCKKESWCN